MSMSPKRRTRWATTRPDSSRKIRSRSVWSSSGTMVTRSLVLERTDLDRAHARGRALDRPCERGVEVGRFDDPIPAEVLLRLGERAVGHDDVVAVAGDDGGARGCVEPAAEHPGAGFVQFGMEVSDLLERLLHLVGGRLRGIGAV